MSTECASEALRTIGSHNMKKGERKLKYSNKTATLNKNFYLFSIFDIISIMRHKGALPRKRRTIGKAYHEMTDYRLGFKDQQKKEPTPHRGSSSFVSILTII